MVYNLADFTADEPIFIDANIFLFHAFDDKEHGDAATAFLTRVENAEVEAVTSSLVIDEVLFKILTQAAAAHLEKPTIWNIKKLLKQETISQVVYEPVLKYRAYLESLAFLGMKIVEVTGEHLFAATDIGSRYGLLITDAAHIAVMKWQRINHLATADADFFDIDGITAWRP